VIGSAFDNWMIRPGWQRGARENEYIRLYKALWTEDNPSFQGKFWQIENVGFSPKPVQQPLPLWIGGNSESAMRRTGQPGDGWIPSFITPARFRLGVEKVRAAAEAAGRQVPGDHFGALVYFHLDDDPVRARAAALPFIPRNRIDDVTLTECAAFGPPALFLERLEEYVEGGGSKFIVRPMCPPDRMLEQIERLAAEVVPALHRR
jgi:alkanesulfonate monooxygenase SsuD/methylene tetrahydromethanopterin reductase-like flavin-dependent oxidoreductase (luciferase family)